MLVRPISIVLVIHGMHVLSNLPIFDTLLAVVFGIKDIALRITNLEAELMVMGSGGRGWRPTSRC
jgi:hypothetical protein